MVVNVQLVKASFPEGIDIGQNPPSKVYFTNSKTIYQGFSSAQSIAVDTAGNIFYTTASSGIYRKQPNSEPPVAVSRNNGCTGITVTSDGTIYIADSQNSQIVKASLSGSGSSSSLNSITNIFGTISPPPPVISSPPTAVAKAQDGSGMILATNAKSAYLIDPTTLNSYTIASSSDGASYKGIAQDNKGYYYIIDSNSAIWVTYQNDCGISDCGINRKCFAAVTQFASAFTFYGLSGIAADVNGNDNIYVVENAIGRISMLSASGTKRTMIGLGTAPDINFYRPVGVAVDILGNLYVLTPWIIHMITRSPTIVPPNSKKTFYILGDSISANYINGLGDTFVKKNMNQYGWGMTLPSFLGQEWNVVNGAIGGFSSRLAVERSTETFPWPCWGLYDLGGSGTPAYFGQNSTPTKCQPIAPGDIVLIVFGQNDFSLNRGDCTNGYPNHCTSSISGFSTVTNGVLGYSYYYYLTRLVQMVRDRGAIPIVSTGSLFPSYDGSGKLLSYQAAFSSYDATTAAVAQTQGGLFSVNLRKRAYNFYNQMTKDQNMNNFHYFDKIAQKRDGHPNYFGAVQDAAILICALNDAGFLNQYPTFLGNVGSLGNEALKLCNSNGGNGEMMPIQLQNGQVVSKYINLPTSV